MARLRDITVVLGALALLLEPLVAPPGGRFLLTLVILWPAVAGYLIVTRRMSPPDSAHLAFLVAAVSAAALVVAGPSIATLRPASLAAGAGSLVLWVVVGIRRLRGDP